MRISDWSSDVCSSHLLPIQSSLLSSATVATASSASAALSAFGTAFGTFGVRRVTSAALSARPRRFSQRKKPRRVERARAVELRFRPVPARAASQADRKRVVEGKGVAGRVDLGGRRIIENKNNKKN